MSGGHRVIRAGLLATIDACGLRYHIGIMENVVCFPFFVTIRNCS